MTADASIALRKCEHRVKRVQQLDRFILREQQRSYAKATTSQSYSSLVTRKR